MSLVTARPAPDCMQPLDAAAAASSSSDHAQHLWEHEMERFVETRGRSRSRSILAADTDTWRDSNHLRATSTRARSCSFSALEPPHSVSAIDYTSAATAALVPPTGASQCAAKRAASLSKIYLAGSAPVDVSQLQSGRSHLSGQKKVRVVQPTGALSAAALDALSEGLQLSVESSATPSMASATLRAAKREALTEEELEEKKMEEEEDCKLKAEKLSARRSLAVRASLFRSKMMKGTTRLLGTAGAMDEGAAAAAAAAATAAAATASATAAAAAAALESERSVESHAGAGADKSATTLDGGAAGDAAGTALPLKKKHKLKLLLLGDSGVGKTSLMRVFSGDEFSESMLATAGVDFKLRHISVADEAITLQIWDTAGQERFHRITSTYYKGANGIVLVYDVSDRRSFDNVGYWMNNIRQYSSPTQMPAMLLVGNKIDLPNRVVASEEGQAAASQYGCRFIETSAKTSENTNGALETIARDGFMISVNPTLTQKMVMDRENTLAGRRNKENCVIQ